VAGAAVAGALPESKSYPQDSQKRPDLAVPQSGHGSAGCPDWAGCGDDGTDAAGDAAGPADPPTRIPQTSQKSLLAES
jgi:hypothetical protein